MAPLLAPESVTVTELASGVDALYLSGRGHAPSALLAALEDARTMARETGDAVPFEVVGVELWLSPNSFRKYPYRLEHPNGLIGVTGSEHIPMLRVQPRAELLHAVGPVSAFNRFAALRERLVDGPVDWSLSRLDLFCDVQGWMPVGDGRQRFFCRAQRRDLHEEGESFTGFEFGRRTTKTVCARIYDKTLQVERKGLDWWHEIWGSAYDRALPVLRIEFELGRQGLKEYGVRSPIDGVEKAGSIWSSLTTEWLTYRTPTSDSTRSRWPVAAAWQGVQQARLSHGAVDIARIRAAQSGASFGEFVRCSLATWHALRH